MIYRNKESGLVKLIIIIVIGIIVLSYFGFDLRGIIEAEQTQNNLRYVWGLVVSLWQNILRRPVLFFWQNIFIDILWETFISNFDRIRKGEPTDFEVNTPTVQFN